MIMNGEFVSELVRAHYEGDDTRFDVVLRQIIAAEIGIGSQEVAQRLTDLRNHYRQGVNHD